MKFAESGMRKNARSARVTCRARRGSPDPADSESAVSISSASSPRRPTSPNRPTSPIKPTPRSARVSRPRRQRERGIDLIRLISPSSHQSQSSHQSHQTQTPNTHLHQPSVPRIKKRSKPEGLRSFQMGINRGLPSAVFLFAAPMPLSQLLKVETLCHRSQATECCTVALPTL